MTSYMDGPKFHISTVSITCTSPNLVLILDTFTFASPDSENTLTLFVSGFFEIVTNSPPRVSSGPLTISFLNRKFFTKCFNINLFIVGRGKSSTGVSSLSKALLTGEKIVTFPAASSSSLMPTKSMSSLNCEKAFLAAGLLATSSSDLTLT